MKNNLPAIAVGTALGIWSVMSFADGCGEIQQPGHPWSFRNAALFSSKVLNVDADGAPNSYLVDGKGLSFNCDGVVAIEDGRRITAKVDARNWQRKCNAAWAKAQHSGDYSNVAIFGFEKDLKGQPIIQAQGDPMAGKGYVSQTSVAVPDNPIHTQRHWVNAAAIPYIVLPTSFQNKFKVRPGSLGLVYRPKTQKYAFAIFADEGNLGEASIKLHQDLGSDPLKRVSGVDRAKTRIEDQVLTAIFPSVVSLPRNDADNWNREIVRLGQQALADFGGIDQLEQCVSDAGKVAESSKYRSPQNR